MKTPHTPLTIERRIEIELLVNAHPGHRSSAIIRELLTEIDELNRRLDTREKNRAKRESFTPPTHAEVAAEFERLGLNGESKSLATAFLAYYGTRNWKDIKVWQKACVTWKLRRGTTPGAGRAAQPQIARTAEPRL